MEATNGVPAEALSLAGEGSQALVHMSVRKSHHLFSRQDLSEAWRLWRDLVEPWSWEERELLWRRLAAGSVSGKLA